MLKNGQTYLIVQFSYRKNSKLFYKYLFRDCHQISLLVVNEFKRID